MTFDRRLFVTGVAGLALTGCDRVATSKPGQKAFDLAGDLTKKVLTNGNDQSYQDQRALKNATLAPEYDASKISKVLKPNGSIDPKDPVYKKLVAEKFASYVLKVGGLVEAPRSFTLAQLKELPVRTQITRHDCVEGWSGIGKWTGAPLYEVLDLVKPKPEARFVVFHCYDRYDTDYTTEAPQQDATLDGAQGPTFYGSIGLDAAVHPQTILAYGFNDEPLPVGHGAPLRVRVERQLGYKMTKYIHGIDLVADFKDIGQGNGGYWEDQGYEWYGGI